MAPGVDSASNRNKRGRCVRLTTLPPSWGIFTQSVYVNFLEPSGHLGPVMGLITFTSPLNTSVFLPIYDLKIKILNSVLLMAFEQQNYNWSRVGNLPSKLAEGSWCTSVLPDEYRGNTSKEATIASAPIFSRSPNAKIRSQDPEVHTTHLNNWRRNHACAQIVCALQCACSRSVQKRVYTDFHNF